MTIIDLTTASFHFSLQLDGAAAICLGPALPWIASLPFRRPRGSNGPPPTVPPSTGDSPGRE